MPNRWDDKGNWEEWDSWCHLRANNPTRREWWLLAAALAALLGVAAVVAKCWPL